MLGQVLKLVEGIRAKVPLELNKIVEVVPNTKVLQVLVLVQVPNSFVDLHQNKMGLVLQSELVTHNF